MREICFSLKVTGGGSASPSKVSIPGYVQPDDPGLTVDIYVRDKPSLKLLFLIILVTSIGPVCPTVKTFSVF